MKKLKNSILALAVCAALALLLTACSYHFGDGLDSGAGTIGEDNSKSEQSSSEEVSRDTSLPESSEEQSESAPEQGADVQESSETEDSSDTEENSVEEFSGGEENAASEESSGAVDTSAQESAGGQPADGELIGTTSKGYDIVVKDGITYVGGILIANKTYPLPADYAPGFTGGTYKAFQVMQEAAANEGIKLEIISGFRSYEKQQQTYQSWVNTYGREYADTISARPGYSEHQSGLAMDLNSLKFAFADTKEGKWLAENCWKYGFIIRYPEDKEDVTGYKYEPWHIRYLGKETAKKVYESGLCLEEYLGIDSEYKD